MGELWDWLLLNPARLLVLISLLVTLCIGKAEHGGRRSGGSGWLTLVRVASGAVFSLVTAIVAGIYGGVGAFFGYLLLQLVVSVVIPMLWVDKM